MASEKASALNRSTLPRALDRVTTPPCPPCPERVGQGAIPARGPGATLPSPLKGAGWQGSRTAHGVYAGLRRRREKEVAAPCPVTRRGSSRRPDPFEQRELELTDGPGWLWDIHAFAFPLGIGKRLGCLRALTYADAMVEARRQWPDTREFHVEHARRRRKHDAIGRPTHRGNRKP